MTNTTFEFETPLTVWHILRIRTAVDLVDLIAQTIDYLHGTGSSRCSLLDDAAVVDHTTDRSHGVTATAKTEHPDLLTSGVVCDNVLVYVFAVIIDVHTGRGIVEVL